MSNEAGGEAARRAVIGAELARLEESAMYSAQGQFEQAKVWRAVNLSLGVPAAVLAAVAGVTSLADLSGGVVSGLLALASAALGGLLTVVNPSSAWAPRAPRRTSTWRCRPRPASNAGWTCRTGPRRSHAPR